MSLVIAITGANGLVGQGVTRAALDQGHSVVALDIPTQGADAFKSEDKAKYTYHQLDATDFDRYLSLVRDNKCTAIVHLAATFNKFDDKGQWLSNVPSHVRLPLMLAKEREATTDYALTVRTRTSTTRTQP